MSPRRPRDPWKEWGFLAEKVHETCDEAAKKRLDREMKQAEEEMRRRASRKNNNGHGLG